MGDLESSIDHLELTEDEAKDQQILQQLELIQSKLKHPNMFISGFDNDDEGIVPPENPDDPGEHLLSAAEEGNQELIKKLVSENPDIIHYKDNDGYTALHRASYTENPDTVRLLLSKGAKVGSKTNDGFTPLHSACHWNSFLCVRALLENNADVNAQTNGGQTPLHYAAIAENGTARESLILLLTCPFIKPDIRNCLNETAYDLACRSGNLSYLFELVRKSINDG